MSLQHNAPPPHQAKMILMSICNQEPPPPPSSRSNLSYSYLSGEGTFLACSSGEGQLFSKQREIIICSACDKGVFRKGFIYIYHVIIHHYTLFYYHLIVSYDIFVFWRDFNAASGNYPSSSSLLDTNLLVSRITFMDYFYRNHFTTVR